MWGIRRDSHPCIVTQDAWMRITIRESRLVNTGAPLTRDHDHVSTMCMSCCESQHVFGRDTYSVRILVTPISTV